MNNFLDDEESVILATYPTRRDAEAARDLLGDADIQSFVRTDDGGGAYPQLQQSNGVKLVGMRGEGEQARSVLAEAGLLPDGEERGASPSETPSKEVASLLYGVVILLGVGALLLVLLMVVWG